MCFIIDRSSPNPLIADRDITCYKEGILKRRDDPEQVFVSPIQGYIYRFQELQPEVKLGPIQKGSIYIYEGYHSYHPCHTILQSFTSGVDLRVLAKCIIPKGSTYYYNPWYLEYVSNRIVVLEVIS